MNTITKVLKAFNILISVVLTTFFMRGLVYGEHLSVIWYECLALVILTAVWVDEVNSLFSKSEAKVTSSLVVTDVNALVEKVMATYKPNDSIIVKRPRSRPQKVRP